MAQSITIKIAGTEYPLVAPDEQREALMRTAAEEINAMLAKYDAKFPDKPLVDKLAFVTLNATVAKLAARQSIAAAQQEIAELCSLTEDYLKGKE